jgi:hypothetical protein
MAHISHHQIKMIHFVFDKLSVTIKGHNFTAKGNAIAEKN